MPNKRHRDKRGGTRFRATDRSKSFRRAHSVKDLLGRLTPTLTRVSDQASAQTFWHQWLAGQLPAALCQHISGIAESNGTLVIYAESAAWSARLRFAVQELHGELHAMQRDIEKISVRVLPRS
ncbi:MAG TPA: DciA family protein [Steroidobacteraceae bacterium]|nr:DciA family protein [Steroidobacteraceae bacterium]